ncbi:single-stranded-DNA-specific exonuclease RecJ [Candidatus Uhrbacteria bacterium]|nr:single-stranded-DNA-specific exonuclease RecJ [Candidatus Uhrbacteria bacterium]
MGTNEVVLAQISPMRSPDEIHSLVSRILVSRGYVNEQQQHRFLHPDYTRDIGDPFLFDDMQRAIDRIRAAIDSNELITIYGDYDVDGVCATAVLFDTLRMLDARVDVVINHRERDGYGLQIKMLELIHRAGSTLVITDDSGISNAAEVAFAVERGIDVIITDHHQIPPVDMLPQAYAIIHPLVRADRYPCKHLVGAGVAFKVVQALLRCPWVRDIFLKKDISIEGFEKWMLDIVAVATVADCMPLLDENRAIVKYGLIVLNKTKRLGLRHLLSCARLSEKQITTHSIGFGIAPRLNAASRMEHGKIAFELLTTSDEEMAQELAQTLEHTNVRRQKLTETIVRAARMAVSRQVEEGKKILIGIGDSWPLGILGLVASRLMNEFKRPVILVTAAEAGRVGAARSIASVHITNIFHRFEYFFLRFGGHAAAGGFSLKPTTDTDLFVNAIHDHADKEVSLQPHELEGSPDAEIRLADITLDLAEQLQLLEPHGIGNPKPIFRISNVTIQAMERVGSQKQHIRLLLSDGVASRKAIAFSHASRIDKLELLEGESVSVIAEIDVHEWRMTRETQLTIRTLSRP